jgi:hypothetical protein
VIGRHANCDIVIDDKAVSSQHCYIARRGNHYLLHDLNSTNGTQVNFQRVTEVELLPKHVVQIGTTELLFDASAEEGSPAYPAANTQIVIDTAPPAPAPKSFSSVSPFGARRQDNRGLWWTLFLVVGILALGGLILFLRALLK